MDQTVHSGTNSDSQRAAKVRRLIHAEIRTPIEVQRRNAEVRATQWEPVAGLGANSLNAKATAGVHS